MFSTYVQFEELSFSMSIAYLLLLEYAGSATQNKLRIFEMCRLKCVESEYFLLRNGWITLGVFADIKTGINKPALRDKVDFFPSKL